jgi:hypothetical protein
LPNSADVGARKKVCRHTRDHDCVRARRLSSSRSATSTSPGADCVRQRIDRRMIDERDGDATVRNAGLATGPVSSRQRHSAEDLRKAEAYKSRRLVSTAQQDRSSYSMPPRRQRAATRRQAQSSREMRRRSLDAWLSIGNIARRQEMSDTTTGPRGIMFRGRPGYSRHRE